MAAIKSSCFFAILLFITSCSVDHESNILKNFEVEIPDCYSAQESVEINNLGNKAAYDLFFEEECFDNFISEYPGSPFREKAFYYRFESAYLYAINSYAYAMPARLATARDYYEDYKRYYPQGEFIGLAEAAIKDIEQKEQQL